MPGDAVEVGRVLGAWGIKGGIRIKPYASDPQALFSSKRWFLRAPAVQGPQVAAALPPMLQVVSARLHGDGVVATAQELPDRTAAEALKGALVYVSRASFPTPEQDEFYWVDLIGMSVFNRQATLLGTVVGLIETGPSSVLRVQRGSVSSSATGAGTGGASDVEAAELEHAEVLIPFVGAYVDSVDTQSRRILVDWDDAD